MSRRPISVVLVAGSLSWALPIIAQIPAPSPTDAVRGTVGLNPEGSRVVYQFDNAKHEAIATTSDSDGKPRGKIVYQICDAGRFVSGDVFGPDEDFLSKSVYTDDAACRLEEV